MVGGRHEDVIVHTVRNKMGLKVLVYRDITQVLLSVVADFVVVQATMDNPNEGAKDKRAAGKSTISEMVSGKDKSCSDERSES